MSKLSKEEVLKLARLARIQVSNEEVAKYQKEFDAVLEYVEQIAKLDLAAYAPTAQVSGKVNATRKDVVKEHALQQELLKNALSLQDDQFKVRRMIG